MKKTIVFDFDGVINTYASGWKGAAAIPDPPVQGMAECICKLIDTGYEVIVVSSRANSTEGKNAIENYLSRWGFPSVKVTAEKPPALVYIDDRAICFDGDTGSLYTKIVNFVPWFHIGSR